MVGYLPYPTAPSFLFLSLPPLPPAHRLSSQLKDPEDYGRRLGGLMNSKKLAEGMLLWAKKPIHTSLTKMDDNEARKLAPKVRNKEEGGGRGGGKGPVKYDVYRLCIPHFSFLIPHSSFLVDVSLNWTSL